MDKLRNFGRWPLNLPWKKNPDSREQELRRMAATGDPRAAHALAQSLLRSGRLTVQDLASLGTPAADALPEDLRKALVQVLAPRVWTLNVSWDDPCRGPGSSARVFLSEATAFREAALLALDAIRSSTADLDTEDPEQADVIEGARSAEEFLRAGDPQAAFSEAAGVLASLDSMCMNEESVNVSVSSRAGLEL